MSTDTPRRPAGAGQRGPLRGHPFRRPTGYRTDDETRLQLEVAAALYEDATLEGVIQAALEEYLNKRGKDPDFRHALRAAERRRPRGS